MLTGEVVSAFNKSNIGDIVGPFITPQGYVLFKYFGSVKSNDVSVRASHILINQFGSDEKNLEEANKLYTKINFGCKF